MQINEHAHALLSELARVGLHATDPEPDRSVAWVNSVCFLFLMVGVLGSKPATIRIKPLPPVEEATAAIVEPLPPPPQTTAPEEQKQDTDQEKPDTPQVVVVVPPAPAINFAVPTIGNLLAPSALATAPPLHPMHAPKPIKSGPVTLNSTGIGGERPQPPYPKIALEQGEQGSVVLLLSLDETGAIASVEVKQSSGYPILDRSALEFVKRHWTVQAAPGARLFQATINYKLRTD